METKHKMALFELVAGLFGWVWIGASIAAIYFLTMVVVSDGEWAQFLWAIGIAIVAKWLARGFDDNKKRVFIEAELIAKGYSEEEAGEIWLEQYNGAPKARHSSSTDE